MPTEIRVPPLGESIYEATVGRWVKAVGEAVASGEAVVELETDKVSLEVAAEADGVLQMIAQPTGSVVGLGDVLGSIGEGMAQGQAGVTIGASATASVAATAGTPAPALATASVQAAPGGVDDETPATPLARRVAEERRIDLGSVQGSGARGRITREDVERLAGDGQQADVSGAAPAGGGAPAQPVPPVAALAASAVAVSAAPSEAAPAAAVAMGREERVRMSRRRQTIARRLVEAQRTAAILTTFNEADLSAVMAIRARRRDAFKERHGVGLGFMSFFTKAAIGALKAFPRLNAEIQGDEMVLKHYYDIGIAVGAAEGLVVPVVRDADRKSFAEIEREIADLAQKARGNTLSLADLQGGTFTITNGGVFGSLLSTPILNTPQVGILGLHKIEERPIALKGEVVIRPMMYLALSYDHRIVDGREAVQFLVRVKELIEDPEVLLLDG